MPVINPNQPTVNVAIPVPQPVQPRQPPHPQVLRPAPPRLSAIIMPWTPRARGQGRTRRRLQRKGFTIKFSEHEAFHRQILHDIDTNRGEGNYTDKEGMSSLAYADYVEEQGHPKMAEFIRRAARRMVGGHENRFGDPTAIMQYTHQMNPERDTPKHRFTVYVYKGSGEFRQRVGRRKPSPTLQVSVKSPHPDKPNSSLAFNLDLPVPEAEQVIRGLMEEGHPAGNEGAARRIPPKPQTNNETN